MPTRRQFLQSVAAAALAPACAPSPRARDQEVFGPEYLEKGLIGISRGNRPGAWSGHWGAAVLAAYYFAREQDLDRATQLAMREQLDALIRGKADSFDGRADGQPDVEGKQKVLEALDAHMDRLSAIGHDVIFSALALRALEDRPELATRGIVDGISTAIRDLGGSGMGGPFHGWSNEDLMTVGVTPEDRIPSYDSPRSIVDFVFSTFADLEIYHGATGGIAGHVLTYTDGLLTLEELGHGSLARRGYEPHQLYIKLARKGFDGEALGLEAKSAAVHSCLTEAYWKSKLPPEWLIGHVFKYPFSFYRRLPSVSDQRVRERALHRFQELL